jgi:hypothetical protein
VPIEHGQQIVDVEGDTMLDYDVTWGIGRGLGDLGAMMGTQPWDPGSVTGFSFTLSGDNIPPSMRFQVEAAGGVAGCVAMDLGATTAGQKSSSFAQVQQRCWNDAANPPAPLPAGSLTQIQWQVVALDTLRARSRSASKTQQGCSDCATQGLKAARRAFCANVKRRLPGSGVAVWLCPREQGDQRTIVPTRRGSCPTRRAIPEPVSWVRRRSSPEN